MTLTPIAPVRNFIVRDFIVKPLGQRRRRGVQSSATAALHRRVRNRSRSVSKVAIIFNGKGNRFCALVGSSSRRGPRRPCTFREGDLSRLKSREEFPFVSNAGRYKPDQQNETLDSPQISGIGELQSFQLARDATSYYPLPSAPGAAIRPLVVLLRSPSRIT